MIKLGFSSKSRALGQTVVSFVKLPSRAGFARSWQTTHHKYACPISCLMIISFCSLIMSPQAEGMAAYTAVPLSNENLNILEPQDEEIIAHTAVPLLRRRQAASVFSNIAHHDIIDVEGGNSQGDDNRRIRILLLWSKYDCVSSILYLGVLALFFIGFSPFCHVAPRYVSEPSNLRMPVVFPPREFSLQNFTSYLSTHKHTFVHFHSAGSPNSQEMRFTTEQKESQ